jgi:hypothetical protein
MSDLRSETSIYKKVMLLTQRGNKMSKLSEWYELVDAELEKLIDPNFPESHQKGPRVIDDLEDRLLGLRMHGVREDSLLWDWAESVPFFGYSENYCCFFLDTDVVSHEKKAPIYRKNKEWRPEDPIWAIENLATKYPTLDSYESTFVTLGLHYLHDGAFLCCVDDGVYDVYVLIPGLPSRFEKNFKTLPHYQNDPRSIAVRLGTFDEFLKLLLDDIRSHVLCHQIGKSMGIDMESGVGRVDYDKYREFQAALKAHPDYLGYDLMYERALVLIGEHFAKLG